MEQNIELFIKEVVAQYGTTREHIIPILQAVQEKYNYLPAEALKKISENTEITQAQLIGVSTFYSQFRHIPAGKHMVKVCVGTACHVKGAGLVYDAFYRHFKLQENQDTDKDGIFTLQEVSCLGCCTLAPVVQIDDITYGKVSQNDVAKIVDDFLAEKSGKKVEDKSILKINKPTGEIRLGLGSCCVASGSENIRIALAEALQTTGIHTKVKQVGCVGMCHQVPILEIIPENQPSTFYAKVKPEHVKEILLKHFNPPGFLNRIKNKLFQQIEKLYFNDINNSANKCYLDIREKPVQNFLGKQIHIATEHKGIINPLDIEEYRSKNGFKALEKSLKNLSSKEIIDIIKQSGLRGKGGAGFPTAIKWETVYNQSTDTKYVICNGDEGDPGAFMDRMLLESFPYRVIEGITIAAYTVGANKAYFYIRAEYPLAVERIKQALSECKKTNLTGKNILGTAFSLDIEIFQGAGAFVCGEETALISSIEGKRGMPRMRPPFPAESGLYKKPTLVNNVETLATIPWIINFGFEKFSQIGTKTSKGTKVFALAGKVARGGLIEVPMGITIREIVDDIGGGIAGGEKFKAVQIGGPSGGCIPASLENTPVDFLFLTEIGAMMGSGGLVVLDETDCVVDIAKYFLSFTQNQSCGKCVFCRVGTKHMLTILEKISTGNGKIEDLQKLEDLSLKIKKGSLCGLGKTAPNPVLTTLKYFREEYEAHIKGICPAKKCKDLISYSINQKCIGCTKCSQSCPTNAIDFKPYEIHSIDVEKCIKCNICKQVCSYDAVDIINKTNG